MPDYFKLLGDGRCANPACQSTGKRLGQMFRRIRIDHGVINIQAANQLLGLSMYFGGHNGLAEVFDPTPAGDHVRFSGDKETMKRVGSEDIVLSTYMLCQDCYMNLPVWLIDSERSVEKLVKIRDENISTAPVLDAQDSGD